MQEIYIVLHSTLVSCQEYRREIRGVFPTLSRAQEAVLDEVNQMLQYGSSPETLCENTEAITLDEERTSHDGGVLKAREGHEDFTEVIYSDREGDPYEAGFCPEWYEKWEIEKHPVSGAAEHDWQFVHDEEVPDTNGLCTVGVICDRPTGHCLFYTVCADEPGAVETCRIYNSATYDPSTLECEFPWTDENDALLLSTLNASDSRNYCGEGAPIQSIKFNPAPVPTHAEALICWKDNHSTEKVTIKLSEDTDPKEDNDIFFYCRGVHDLHSLDEENSREDFFIVSYRVLYRG